MCKTEIFKEITREHYQVGDREKYEIYLTPRPDTHLRDCIAEAINILKREDAAMTTYIKAPLNIHIEVDENADPNLMYLLFCRYRLLGKPWELIEPFMVSDEVSEAEGRLRSVAGLLMQKLLDKSRAAFDRERFEERRKLLDEKLRDAPPMEFADEEFWRELRGIYKDSPFESAVLDFTERWARLMQMEIASGAKIEDIFRSTFRLADIYDIAKKVKSDISPFEILCLCWIHRQDLLGVL